MDVSRISEFKLFIAQQVTPALNDIENLEEKNRKHLQKLVFSNLVDRFDHLVDKLILDNCREDVLVKKAVGDKASPMSELDFIQLLIEAGDFQGALDRRLQDKLRTSTLSQNHARKLNTLLGLFDNVGDVWNKPRVTPVTGKILESFKVQKQQIPATVCGYADWLYSRRNAIVHGAGTQSYSQRDIDRIKKAHRVNLRKTFRVTVASSRNASTFYLSLCALIE